MSFVRLALETIGNIGCTKFHRVISIRGIRQSSIHCKEQVDVQEVEDNLTEDSTESEPKKEINPASDRSKVIPVETSIKYLQSDAYKETYGSDPVWKMYKRNFKGQFIPRETRKTCIRNDVLATSNPCPICRDEYLVLDHRNVDLLNQFISPYNGEIIKTNKTGLCRKKHTELIIAIERAKNFGTISFDVPFRKYNYSEWYIPESGSKKKQ